MYDINDILLRPDRQAIENRFRARFTVDRPDVCWEWRGAISAKGYGQLTIPNSITLQAHRLAYLFKHEHFPRLTVDGWYACACHHCDNPLCVNPAHLFIGSTVDNNHDRHRKGRSAGGRLAGEDIPWHKLTNEQVLGVYQGREPARVVAPQLGVSESLIYRIRSGRAWKHLTQPK